MMGLLTSGQQRLFYSFNLEDHVPPQHLLRSIDQCLDLSGLRAYLADFYSPIGRPRLTRNWWCACWSSVTAMASVPSGDCTKRCI